MVKLTTLIIYVLENIVIGIIKLQNEINIFFKGKTYVQIKFEVSLICIYSVILFHDLNHLFLNQHLKIMFAKI